MSYSNVLNAVNIYGNVLGKGMDSYGNKGNQLGNIDDSTIYGRTTPYRGPNTFMDRSSRNIYGNEVPEVYDPRSMYQDEEGNWIDADPLVRGTGAVQTALMAKELSPYASKALGYGKAAVTGQQYIKNIATGEIAQISAKASPAVGWETTSGPGIGPGLGWGLAVKSFTNDQNPYTYTGREKIGDYAGNAMIGSSLAPIVGATGPVGIALSVLYSLWSSKKKKRKARRLIAKAKKEVSDAQLEGYEDRSQQVQDARDKYLADSSSRQWEQEASKYDNQYGGAYNTSYGEEGMKFSPLELAKGDEVNTVAEFTGNELIVNDQTTVEKGLSKNNYSMAAAPIRKAMNKGYVTPGIETHQGNPMPVDDKGNIYAGGGTLPFQVNKGAGVYDHATDQFRPTMTDKEIAMVAQSNINKWESNGMA